jgi:histone deacetylase complex regulatory component SIN3
LLWRQFSVISFAILYGFNQKTPQGKNQQAQTSQEAALESSQEAHLAEVSSALRVHSSVRGRLQAVREWPFSFRAIFPDEASI